MDRGQKPATIDKLKLNFLVEASNEVEKALGVVYTFREDLKYVVLVGSFPAPRPLSPSVGEHM